MKGPWKALSVLGAVVATALVLSASALAVGGGSSPASPKWKIRLGSAGWSGRLTALYPGAANDTEVFRFTVTNQGHSTQRLRSVMVSILTSAGGDVETAAGTVVHGCQADWFGISVTSRGRSLPAAIAPGASYAGKVGLLMRGADSNQTACRWSSPAFRVSVQ
jgi:hypothetical protein